MKLTIHRGTHEIGGNCVEIATNSTRIIVDVGMPLFKANREQFDDRVIRGKSVDELLEEKILPNVPGLFVEGPELDAILLTHGHLATPVSSDTPSGRSPFMPPRAQAR